MYLFFPSQEAKVLDTCADIYVEKPKKKILTFAILSQSLVLEIVPEWSVSNSLKVQLFQLNFELDHQL